MERTTGYPAACTENIRTITGAVRTDEHTAYAMILLTAALMDLCPSDPQVAEIILDDCKRIRTVSKT